ncbi:MAG: OmpA family protein [Cytophagaceae bacterium]|nr:OmpA family protein [Cytophagaceae bacterium]
MLPLLVGDTYEIEATLDGYVPARKTIRLVANGRSAQAVQLVVLEMKPLQVPITIYILDDQTGKPIAGGFAVRMENLDRTQSVVNRQVAEATIRLLVQPHVAIKGMIKAKGYHAQAYAFANPEAGNEITLRLQRIDPTQYGIRMMDSDYRYVSSQCTVLIQDELGEMVPASYDKLSGDWRVLLQKDLTYSIEVKAPGYRTHRRTIAPPAQSVIMVLMQQDLTPTAKNEPVARTKPEPVIVAPPTAAKPPLSAPPAGAGESKGLGKIADKVSSFGRQLERLDSSAMESKMDRTVNLDNVYFDQSSPDIRPDSHAQLDELAEWLKGQPEFKVEIAGHTDRLGDPRLNVFLSENRAKAILNYLVKKGVPRKRMRYMGYGFSRPVAPSDVEENQKKNRRVEVRVIK